MQVRKFAFLCVLAFVASTLPFSGCSKSRIKGLVPAEGVVTFNGAPVEGATVLFAPKTVGTEAGSASALTDKNGKFKMTTLDPGDGLFPGDYYVTVSKDRVEGGPTLEDAKLSHDEYEAKAATGAFKQVTIRELPAKYADINESGLGLTIPPEGKKDISLALEGEADLTPIEQQSGRGSAPGL